MVERGNLRGSKRCHQKILGKPLSQTLEVTKTFTFASVGVRRFESAAPPPQESPGHRAGGGFPLKRVPKNGPACLLGPIAVPGWTGTRWRKRREKKWGIWGAGTMTSSPAAPWRLPDRLIEDARAGEVYLLSWVGARRRQGENRLPGSESIGT